MVVDSSGYRRKGELLRSRLPSRAVLKSMAKSTALRPFDGGALDDLNKRGKWLRIDTAAARDN